MIFTSYKDGVGIFYVLLHLLLFGTLKDLRGCSFSSLFLLHQTHPWSTL